MEHRELRIGREALLRRLHLVDVDPVQRPPMTARDRLELALRFGERDVERPLTEPHAFEQKLQRERRLPAPRIAFDEVQPTWREPAAQDVIEPCDSSRYRWAVELLHASPFAGQRDGNRMTGSACPLSPRRSDWFIHAGYAPACGGQSTPPARPSQRRIAEPAGVSHRPRRARTMTAT